MFFSFWFNSTATVSIQHLEKVKQLDDDCPRGCKCVPDRMFYSSENRLEFIAKVDCSNLDLTELPLKLPEHTLSRKNIFYCDFYIQFNWFWKISVNISNNSISSLVPLTNNDFYKGIRDLFADDNLIKSLEEIEGTEFLENFTKLSLKNNKINFVSWNFLEIRIFVYFHHFNATFTDSFVHPVESREKFERKTSLSWVRASWKLKL